ncbi:MAG: hypothetical protein AAFO63_04915 [Pseudomonadota bacterium]
MLINKVLRGTSFGVVVLAGTFAAQAESFAASQTAQLDVPAVLNSSAIDIEFEEAKVAQPGQRTRFHLSFTNEGAEPAQNIVLLMPVPNDVDVVTGTATSTRADVSYSIDGGLTFTSPEDLLAGVTTQENASVLADVTTVRWALKTPVAPGASGALSYEGVFQ